MNIKFNKKLFWDYQITEKDLENEQVLIFYLSRMLNNGSYQDIKDVPLEIIKKYFDRLSLSRNVREFWEWYLNYIECEISTSVKQ